MSSKLKLPLKIIAACIVVAGVFFLINSDKKILIKSTEKEKSVEVKREGPTLYDPSSVTEFSWTINSKTLRFVKSEEGTWAGPRDFKNLDSWQIQRRLVIFSHLPLEKNFSLKSPTGRVSIKTPQAVFEGLLTDHLFIWESGPEVGSGLDFSQNEDLKSLFAEGFFGFQNHNLNLCDAEKIITIKNIQNHESFHKENNRWLNQNNEPMKPQSLKPWLEHLCTVKIDSYVAATSTREKGAAVLALSEKNGPDIAITLDQGLYGLQSFLLFYSKELDETLKTTSKELRDLSLDEAKVALDSTKPTSERVEAIRHLKDLKSPESLPALKKIIFEKTDMDVFRYEAVDALSSINTPESMKILAERLGEIDGGGFQLRLARSLGNYLGYPFTSDEHTPADVRQNEVKDLLEEYKKQHPQH